MSAGAASADRPPTVPTRLLLEALKGFVESHLDDAGRQLRAVAASDDADAADWARLSAPLQALADGGAKGTFYWLADLSGRTRSTGAGGAQPPSTAELSAFPELYEMHDVRGRLQLFRHGGPRITVATPIVRDARVIGSIGAAIAPAALVEIVYRRCRLTLADRFMAIDDSGVFALHPDPQRIGALPVAEPEVQAAVRQFITQESGEARFTLRGAPHHAHYLRSRRLGWRFALVRPAS